MSIETPLNLFDMDIPAVAVDVYSVCFMPFTPILQTFFMRPLRRLPQLSLYWLLKEFA